MSRWGARIAGLIVLLLLIFVLMQMQKTLERIRDQQGGAATST